MNINNNLLEILNQKEVLLALYKLLDSFDNIKKLLNDPNSNLYNYLYKSYLFDLFIVLDKEFKDDELLLNDDKELRAYIKELIQNEVINIAREQITNTVKEVLDKKLNNQIGSNKNRLDDLIDKEISSQIGVFLKSYFYYGKDNNYLHTYIDNKVKTIIDHKFKELVVDLIKELK